MGVQDDGYRWGVARPLRIDVPGGIAHLAGRPSHRDRLERDLAGQRASFGYDANGNRTSAAEAQSIAGDAYTIATSFNGFDELERVSTPKAGRMKRQQRTEGAVVEIPLGSGRRAFGRLRYEPLVDFFDLELRDSNSIDLDRIVRSPVAFTIYVMNSAVTSGRWPTVGTKPLTDAERATVPRFCKKDALTGALSIYWEDPLSDEAHEVPASREECQLLEPAAVWSAEHVEDRLRDHFEGRPNKWRKSINS